MDHIRAIGTGEGHAETKKSGRSTAKTAQRDQKGKGHGDGAVQQHEQQTPAEEEEGLTPHSLSFFVLYDSHFDQSLSVPSPRLSSMLFGSADKRLIILASNRWPIRLARGADGKPIGGQSPSASAKAASIFGDGERPSQGDDGRAEE
ncbi:hypothetical protein niasHT_007965 [Heterodera trifolii]|uniref:Uncharacterized protein n=1 Tax=Heterodera trifolii TaxID=157864 RepID=A0ABD2M007_9BILA